MTGKADLAASIARRLLNRARQTGEDHQTLLTSYCLERFLYRLGVSGIAQVSRTLPQAWFDARIQAKTTLSFPAARRRGASFTTI